MSSNKYIKQLCPMPPQELRDLFVLQPDHVARSVTAEQLNALHAKHRNASAETNAHIAALEELGDCRGVSDHDLLFTQRLVEEERALGQPSTTGTHWVAKRAAMGLDSMLMCCVWVISVAGIHQHIMPPCHSLSVGGTTGCIIECHRLQAPCQHRWPGGQKVAHKSIVCCVGERRTKCIPSHTELNWKQNAPGCKAPCAPWVPSYPIEGPEYVTGCM